jgi:hypothetical protein
MGITLTRTDLLVTTALFIALSPGLLLSLPPSNKGNIFAKGETSIQSDTDTYTSLLRCRVRYFT